MTSPRHFIWLCFTIYFLTSLTLTEPSSSDRTQINLKPAVHQKPNSKIDSRIDPNRFPRSTLAFSPSSSARSPLPLFPTLSSLFLSSSAPALPAHVPIRLLRLLFYQGETRVLPNVASLAPPILPAATSIAVPRWSRGGTTRRTASPTPISSTSR